MKFIEVERVTSPKGTHIVHAISLPLSKQAQSVTAPTRCEEERIELLNAHAKNFP